MNEQPKPLTNPMVDGKRSIIVRTKHLQLDTMIPSEWQCLSDDERIRARRFAFEGDRNRFVLSRSFLRTELAQETGIRPDAITFGYGPMGKPYLLTPDDTDLTFNLAHSGDAVVVAMARGLAVGIDIEQIREIEGIQKIAAKIMHHDELKVFQTIPTEERLRFFFQMWTHKEAIMKAIGTGFNFNPQSILIDGDFASPAVNVSLAERDIVYRVCSLSLSHLHIAALAVETDAAFTVTVSGLNTRGAPPMTV